MRKIGFAPFLTLLSFAATAGHAQTLQEQRLAVVHKMIEGYNRQDYAMLKQPWAGMGKLVVSRSMLRAELEPVFRQYGSAKADTVIFSDYTYTARLKMEKMPAGRRYLQFIFNENAKLEGFGFGYPPFIYRRRYNQQALDDVAFRKRLDGLMADRYLKDAVKPFNGSVMVLDDGRPVYLKHFGYADFDRKTALNDTTRYELASCSKQFTAMAILLLEKEGKLRLGDSVQRFLPGLPYPGITIRHLLTHSSGIPDYEVMLRRSWDRAKFATNDDVISMLRERHLKAEFLPGERFAYSNTGYVLLASVIERASGASYGSYLARNIFTPLGMKHTRVYNTRRAQNEAIDNYALGYVWAGDRQRYILPDSLGKYSYVVYQDAIVGDGTVNTCMADLQLWEQELLAPRLLDKALVRQAMANNTTNDGKPIDYGYGFLLRGGGSAEPVVMHTGGWPGYTSVIMNFFDQRKQIIVLSNNAYDDFTRLADDIALMLLEDQ